MWQWCRSIRILNLILHARRTCIYVCEWHNDEYQVCSGDNERWPFGGRAQSPLSQSMHAYCFYGRYGLRFIVKWIWFMSGSCRQCCYHYFISFPLHMNPNRKKIAYTCWNSKHWFFFHSVSSRTHFSFASRVNEFAFETSAFTECKYTAFIYKYTYKYTTLFSPAECENRLSPTLVFDISTRDVAVCAHLSKA